MLILVNEPILTFPDASVLEPDPEKPPVSVSCIRPGLYRVQVRAKQRLQLAFPTLS